MMYLLRFLTIFFGIVLRPFHRRWKPGKPIRCLLVGYGGANNTGAEARTDEAIKQMRQVVGDDLHITVTSLDRRRSLRYTGEDDCVKIVQVPSVFMFSLARLVLGSDIVVLVEGYCFMEFFSQVLFWFFMYAADLAQRLGIPTVAYAVDAGRLSSANARWAKKVAGRMDLLMVRTRAAANELIALDVVPEVVVTADTAFALHPAPSEWVNGKLHDVGFDRAKPIIGIAFEEFFWWPVVPSLGKYLRGQRHDRYKSMYYHTWSPERRRRSRVMKEAVAEFADWAGHEFDAEIAFFAMERVNAEPCSDVIGRMTKPAALFDADSYDAHEMLALIQSLTFLVTSEYHASIFAIMGRIPLIGLGNDERIQSLMDEVGLKNDFYIHYDESHIADKLKDKSRSLMQRRDDIQTRLIASLPSYVERMRSNGRYFALLVNEKFIGKGS